MLPVGDLRLLAATGWRMLREDPTWLAVQAARRFLPVRARAWVAGRGGHGVPQALGAFIGDQPDKTAALLRRRGVTGDRPGDRLAARLAVQVGAPDALGPRAAAWPQVVAAVAAERGDLSGALAALGGSGGAAARKARGEWRLLQPGFGLPVPAVAWAGPGSGVRVLHVLTNSVPHTRSGYTSRTHHLLRAARDAGAEVEAVTRIGYPTTVGVLVSADADIVDGITYRRLRAGHLAADPVDRLSQQVDAVIAVAQQFRPAILHTTTDYTNALVTQAVASALGIPWVYEMRGQLELSWVAARAEAYRAAAESSERVLLLREKEAELAAAADAVVVLSGVQREDLLARSVDPDRIVVVPNAIDPGLLERDSTPVEARRRVGLPTEGVWLGTVSSLVAYEGLDDLLEAVALLRAEGHDARALIVGDGVSRTGLVALADDLGLGGAALFPGRVPASASPDWFAALDVFVVPRKDTPVCRVVTPLKPVEAMALARPVAASDLPALREVTADGSAGTLFPAGDAVGQADALRPLVLDAAARRARGEVARAQVRGRTWSVGAGTLLRVYQQVGG